MTNLGDDSKESFEDYWSLVETARIEDDLKVDINDPKAIAMSAFFAGYGAALIWSMEDTKRRFYGT